MKVLPDTNKTATTFQFLHGTIKGDFIVIDLFCGAGFQFLHGTIKGSIYQTHHDKHIRYFNSYMVRLKVYTRQYTKDGIAISIPTWYD